ncbi:MAG: hypothetical protein AAGF11_37290 [Myxococcota bacterium]
MTLAHFIYIPGVLIFGIVVGYVLGGRAAQMAQAEQEDKAQRRQAREAARRARDRAAKEVASD